MTNAACSLLKHLSRFAMILASIFLISDYFPSLTTQTILPASENSTAVKFANKKQFTYKSDLQTQIQVTNMNAKKDAFNKSYGHLESGVYEKSINGIHRVFTSLVITAIDIFKGVRFVAKVRCLGHDLINFVLAVKINF